MQTAWSGKEPQANLDQAKNGRLPGKGTPGCTKCFDFIPTRPWNMA